MLEKELQFSPNLKDEYLYFWVWLTNFCNLCNMMKRIDAICFLFLLVISVLIITNCASPAAPQGGPKDDYPPKIILVEPLNGSVDFDENSIRLYFNEFVKLNNPSEEVFISPPVNEMPDFTVRGKSVIIKLKEELKDSTTYSIYMGKAIQDITESNPLAYYTYVFSTGNKLDSLSILGEVYNAFNLEPQSDVVVLLYKDHYDTIPLDSVPYLVKPIYAAKTIEDGIFVINNLRPGNYKLFALKDINKSMTFDQPTEEIAFLDSMISPIYIEPFLEDSIILDSVYINSADTVTKDSVEYPYYSLSMFQEIDSTQRLLEKKLVKPKMLLFVFRFPTKNPEIIPMDTIPGVKWSLSEWNKGKDTLRYWLLDVIQDSMEFIIKNDTMVVDTIELPLKKDSRSKRSRRKDEDTTHPIGYKTNIVGRYLELDHSFIIHFDYPIIKHDFSDVLLIDNNDTIKAVVEFVDTIINRRLKVKHKWKPKTDYSIIFPDSIMIDLMNYENDSINIKFSSKSMEDYGTLKVIIDIQDTTHPYIIQLMDEKERVIKETVIFNDKEIEYKFLDPIKYIIKAVIDRNRNGRWDSGDYLKHLQPEEVLYFPGIITMRANWDIDETWQIK